MTNLLHCHRCGYVAFEEKFYHSEDGEESVFCPNCPDYKNEFNSVSELHPNDIKKLTNLNYER